MLDRALGIDVGASGIKGAIVNLQTGELESERVRLVTPTPKTPKNMISTIEELIKIQKWNGPIGIGFPSIIKDGTALSAANIDKSWINVDIKRAIQEATKCPTQVINDADAAGLAESKFGIAKDYSDGTVLFLTLGSGIGSALIHKGVLIPNTEFGHLELKGNIAEKFAADSVRKQQNLKWREWGKRLNRYLKLVERATNPDIIIIGGGVSKSFSKFEEFIKIDTTVKAAELKNNAGIVGAALTNI